MEIDPVSYKFLYMFIIYIVAVFWGIFYKDITIYKILSLFHPLQAVCVILILIIILIACLSRISDSVLVFLPDKIGPLPSSNQSDATNRFDLEIP